MIASGDIHIHLTAHEVQIVSSRPQFLSRLCVGKPLSQVLTLIPRLYSICRHAQSIGTARAAEQALGQTADTHTEIRRTRLLRLEMLHEHLWKLLVDLPPVLGLSADIDVMAAASKPLRRIMQHLDTCGLSINEDENSYHGSVADAASLSAIHYHLFGNTELRSRPTHGKTARMLATLAPLDWSTNHDLDDKETGPIARVGDHLENQGCLQARYMALITETDQLLRGIYDRAPWDGDGVETARGQLNVSMCLQSQTVTHLSVCSPTDRNFSAQGPVARLLAQLPGGCRQSAEALIKLVNPCVAYRLTLESEVHAYA